MDHAKTDAGIRTIPLTNDAKKILAMVELSCKKYDYYDDGRYSSVCEQLYFLEMLL